MARLPSISSYAATKISFVVVDMVPGMLFEMTNVFVESILAQGRVISVPVASARKYRKQVQPAGTPV